MIPILLKSHLGIVHHRIRERDRVSKGVARPLRRRALADPAHASLRLRTVEFFSVIG